MKETVQNEESLLDKWLNDYWKMNFSGMNSVKEMDNKIQSLINFLLITGEEQITGKYQGHSKDKILN